MDLVKEVNEFIVEHESSEVQEERWRKDFMHKLREEAKAISANVAVVEMKIDKKIDEKIDESVGAVEEKVTAVENKLAGDLQKMHEKAE